jgi:hypothetical protein
MCNLVKYMVVRGTHLDGLEVRGIVELRLRIVYEGVSVCYG